MKTYKITYLGRELEVVQNEDGTFKIPVFIKEMKGSKFGLQSLKPALEPIYMGQKPHLKPMVRNVDKYGVGAMNIDGCRTDPVGMDKRVGTKVQYGELKDKTKFGQVKSNMICGNPQGRHPANLVHDGSEVVEREFLEQGGVTGSNGGNTGKLGVNGIYGSSEGLDPSHQIGKGDTGSVSRYFNKLQDECECNEAPHVYPNGDVDHEAQCPFFYVPKASKGERNAGCEGMELKERNTTTGATRPNKPARIGADPHAKTEKQTNHHPTVKPIKLMRWLCRLVTPPGGIIIDPFAGSGSTIIAAMQEGLKPLGIEREKEYYEIAKARCEHAKNEILCKEELDEAGG